MKAELFIAKRLQLQHNKSGRSAVSTLNVAVVGMVLAIVIMVVAVSVVTGFKHTIVDKISSVDSHIKIFNRHYDEYGILRSSVERNEVLDRFISTATDPRIKAVNLISEIPCVLKSETAFTGLRYKGVTDSYDISFLTHSLKAGKADISGNSVMLSKATADKLCVNPGDKLYVYFMNNQRVRMRRCTVAGVFDTDLDSFDDHVLVGNISTLQSVNEWSAQTGSYISIECRNVADADAVKEVVIDRINQMTRSPESTFTGEFMISTIRESNPSHFAWLDLLNTNVYVVLGLMAFVACFSIIGCLIIVVLDHINTIGVLKALGANNANIRTIFISIMVRIILRAMIWGNATAFLLLLLQKYFHIVRLNSESYFMSYVPVEFNQWLLILNIGIFIVAFLALLIPSFIVSSISPAKTMRYE